MPDNFDDEQIDNMSIDEINELFKDVIELPEDIRVAASLATPAGAQSAERNCWGK